MSLWACLVPLGVYAGLRAMRFPHLVALGAGAATLVVFVAENARVTAGLALGLLFLGVAYRGYSRERAVWLPAGCLAAAAVASGHAAVWAAGSTAYFLYAARRPWRTLRWLAAVGAIAVGLSAFHLASLLAAAPRENVVAPAPIAGLPAVVIPILLAAVAAFAVSLVRSRGTGGPDHRLLLLAHGALTAGVLAIAAPVLRLSSAGFWVAAEVALVVTGVAALGSLLANRRRVLGSAMAGLLLLGLFVIVRGMPPTSAMAPAMLHAPQSPVAWIGIAVTLLTVLVGAAWPWLRRRRPEPPVAPVSVETLECEFESAPPRWGGLIPAGLMLVLVLARLCGLGSP
jgi:hypothetical protein